MIAVIFEVLPRQGKLDPYLDMAATLRPELDTIDGFISVERFQSIMDPSKYLSLKAFPLTAESHGIPKSMIL